MKNNPILLLSFENDKENLVTKLLLSYSNFSPDNLSDCEWIDLCELAGDLLNVSMFVVSLLLFSKLPFIFMPDSD